MHSRSGKARYLRPLVLLVVLTLAIVVATSAASACPMCKQALANTPGGVQGGIVRGYFWSILFMMSMPFLLFGSFCAYMYYEVRKARRKLATAQAAMSAAAADHMTSDVLEEAAAGSSQAADQTPAVDREPIEV